MQEVCKNCKLFFHCQRHKLSMKSKKYSRSRKKWLIRCNYFCPVDDKKLD